MKVRMTTYDLQNLVEETVARVLMENTLIEEGRAYANGRVSDEFIIESVRDSVKQWMSKAGNKTKAGILGGTLALAGLQAGMNAASEPGMDMSDYPAAVELQDLKSKYEMHYGKPIYEIPPGEFSDRFWELMDQCGIDDPSEI